VNGLKGGHVNFGNNRRTYNEVVLNEILGHNCTGNGRHGKITIFRVFEKMKNDTTRFARCTVIVFSRREIQVAYPNRMTVLFVFFLFFSETEL
jgi:hypothetical protein